MNKPLFYIFLFISLSFALFADRIEVPPGDYEILLPVGWTLYDQSNLEQLSFVSDNETAMLQISYFSGDSFSDVDSMFNQLLAELSPQGEESRFPYLQWEAWMSDMLFTLGEQEYRGWFLLLNGEEIDYMLMLFTPMDQYEENFPWIISTLDAFSPGSEATRHPGPVSTMLQAGESIPSSHVLSLGDQNLPFRYDMLDMELTQELIEREAQLLYQYSVNEPLFRLAWDRYYNLIYRDNYSRLESLCESLRPFRNGKSDQEFMEFILKWIQGFTYSSSNTFSDLLSPLTSAVESRGDCDSLSLLYLMILEYYDIHGVFIVSEVYSHAMAAVPSDADGASFIYQDQRYVVAEMTDQVALGQIAATMADMSKWQIIAFPR